MQSIKEAESDGIEKLKKSGAAREIGKCKTGKL
jgi:hypothetical protein